MGHADCTLTRHSVRATTRSTAPIASLTATSLLSLYGVTQTGQGHARGWVGQLSTRYDSAE